MSLYQCPKCGVRENTVTGYYYSAILNDEHPICSECHSGEWHGIFPKLMLPKGEFKTNAVGNLEHIDTGDTEVEKYAI